MNNDPLSDRGSDRKHQSFSEMLKAIGPVWSLDEADHLKAAIADSRALDIAQDESDRRAVMGKHITVEVEQESRLTKIVRESEPNVDGLTAIVDGRRFRMVEETPRDYWATTTLSEHFAKFRHLLDGIDSDELIENIYRRRRGGSRYPVDE
jgi:hypothetical protein